MGSTQSMLLVAGLCVASLASAQGIVTGLVSAPDQPAVSGQRVTLSSTVLPQAREALTDDSGTYRFSQLPPGTYSLKLERPSFRPAVRRGILVRSDTTVQVDVALRKSIGAAEETIPVGPPPAVDVGSAAQGVTLGKDFFDRVPLVAPNALGARTVEQAAMAAPQVVRDRYGFGFSGSLSPENLYLLDGAPVNDPMVGTLRGTVGAGGSQLPLEFVDQVNVTTGALGPELGRASGGVLDVRTKSGSNEWHGSVFGSWLPGALTAKSLLSPPDTSSFAFSSKRHNTGDFGAELGGALIKDRLWIHGGVVQSVDRRRVTRTIRQFRVTEDGKDFVYDENGSIHSEPLTSASAFDDRRSLTYLGKLTWFVTPEHTLSASITGGPQRRLTPDFAPKGYGGLEDTSDTTSASLRYSGSFLERRLLVDATASWTHFQHSTLPSDGSRVGLTSGAAGVPQVEFTRTAPYSVTAFEELPGDLGLRCEAASFVPTRTVTSRGTVRFVMACPATGVGASSLLGGPGLMTEAQSDRLTAKAAATFHFQLLGHHAVKAGVDLDWTRANVLSGWSGGIRFTELAAGGGFLGSGDTAALVGPDQRISQLSSTSTPSQLSTGAFLGDSWNLVDAVRINAGLRYDTQQLFASNGALGLTFNNVLSPRLGLVYDFTKQGRSKVFANYGLYQQALPLNAAGRGLSGETRTITLHRADACSAIDDPKGCASTPGTTLNRDPLAPSPTVVQLPSSPLAVDPLIKPMLKGELTAGLEYELWSNLRVGFVGTHSWLINAVETLSNDGASWFLGNPGSGQWGKDFAPADRKYFAATLYGTKAFTNGWLVQTSYTYSSTSGTYAGLLRPETGTLDPNLTRELGLPSSAANRSGFLATDHTHQLKAYVAKDFELSNEWLLSVGASYEGLSGAPVSYLAADPILGQAATFVFPRGAAGRLPWSHTVNLRGQVGYRLSKDQALQVTLDVFNVFNAQEPTEVLQRLSASALQPASVPDGKTPAEAACLAGNDPRCVSVLKTSTGGTATAADYDPTFKQPTTVQAPLSVRLGVKLSF